MASNRYTNKAVVAMDCEMVGVRRGFREEGGLAQCCIIDQDGNVLLDTYCRPDEEIVSYRTPISGITPSLLEDAPTFTQVRRKVQAILQGQILVGHSVHFDLKALQLTHPYQDTRDVFNYPYLHNMVMERGGGGKSLRNMTEKLLGRDIQSGSHSAMEDARATLDIYKLVQNMWEKRTGRMTELSGQFRVGRSQGRRASRRSLSSLLQNM